MRVGLHIAAVFIAVGLGALTVTLLYDPMALVPHPPYWHWVIERIFAVGALAGLGTLLVLDVEDDSEAVGETGGLNWRVVGLAFLISVLASATFVGAVALTRYLDGFFA
jgi:hypothetical protein